MKSALIIDLLDDELRKFSNVCFEFRLVMPMFSAPIDDRWHIQIEGTQQIKLAIHDTNIKSLIPTAIEWIPYYEICYGKLNKVWFVNNRGRFLNHSYDDYIRSGKVISTFNCAAKTI
jgi:hypothetical protein